MAAPEPPVPYLVVYSDAVERRLDELSDVAHARGDGPAFVAALKKFRRGLELFPQFGDPLIDMVVGEGQIRTGIIAPLCMRYGVHEDKRIVFCGALPTLMPMSKPDTETDE